MSSAAVNMGEEGPNNGKDLVEVKRWRIKSDAVREILAEIFGVFLICTFGNGSVAQSVLSNGNAGGMLSINLAYGLGVTFAIYFTATVSGAHLNPAVTISLAIFRKFPWKKTFYYVIAQMIGGFLSGVAVYVVYYDALNNFDDGTRIVMGVNGTAGIFATYPKDFLSIGNGVLDQLLGTGLLVGSIFAVSDQRNNKIADGLGPIIIGLLVALIGMSFGFNCGYAINPARDFGPRLFTSVAGWGSGVWTEPDGAHWWIVPFFIPYIGGFFGAFFYEASIGYHLESNEGKSSDVELQEKRS